MRDLLTSCLLGFLGFLAGCCDPYTEQEVVGHYQLRDKGVTEDLWIEPGGRLRQIVELSDGRRLESNSTWKFDRDRACRLQIEDVWFPWDDRDSKGNPLRGESFTPLGGHGDRLVIIVNEDLSLYLRRVP